MLNGEFLGRCSLGFFVASFNVRLIGRLALLELASGGGTLWNMLRVCVGHLYFDVVKNCVPVVGFGHGGRRGAQTKVGSGRTKSHGAQRVVGRLDAFVGAFFVVGQPALSVRQHSMEFLAISVC